MTRHLGDFDASTVVYGKFTTFRPSTGAAYTLGGTPAISVYKDNSTTQSTTGVTLTADFDSLTGLNHFTIDTSTDGAFYAAGSFFDIVITTGTVDSVSVVGTVVGSFTIRKNSALKPTTAARTLDVSAGGEAGVDWANVGGQSTAVNLSSTTTNLVNTITTYTGNTPQTGDSFARIGATGSGLTTLATAASISALNNLSAAQVNTEVDTALADIRLDELLAADSDIDGLTPPTVGSVFHELMTKTAGSFTYDQTTDSLEALRDRGDAAWITATGFSTHSAADVWSVATRILTAGTNIALAKGTGVTGFNDLDAAGIRTSVGLASANLDTQLTAIDDYLDTEISAIKAKTDQMVFTTANRLDCQVYGMESNTMTASALASDAVTEIQSGLATSVSVAALPTAAQNATAVLTTQLTEGYAADGVAPTVTQALMLVQQSITDFSISGTALTIKKLDGSTTAATLTLNDATSPTSVTRTG